MGEGERMWETDALRGLLRKVYRAWSREEWEEGESLESVMLEVDWACRGNAEEWWTAEPMLPDCSPENETPESADIDGEGVDW